MHHIQRAEQYHLFHPVKEKENLNVILTFLQGI